MRKTMLVLLALLMTVTALYAEEPVAETTLTLGDVDFPIVFYERHFDVERRTSRIEENPRFG